MRARVIFKMYFLNREKNKNKNKLRDHHHLQLHTRNIFITHLRFYCLVVLYSLFAKKKNITI